ncbi:MAG TPA: FtsX-like permease family protein, partial [Vicinamibacteria bacterium]|nr:FtsX-like permease family protein [Vicinamibacteria bacterium]
MLSPTLLRTGLRDLLRRPLHTGLMVLGVALGVAVVVAIDLANESARRGFARSTEAIAGRATHQLRGGPTGVPEDVLRRLRLDWGVRASAPVVEAAVFAPDLYRGPLTLLGIDPLSEGPFRTHLGEEAPAASGFARFLDDEGAVIVGSGLADRQGLALGSSIRLLVEDRFETVRVMGIVRHPAGTGDPLDGLLLMDVGAAQKLLRSEGFLTRIDLIADEAAAARLRPLLPTGVQLHPASEQAETLTQLTAAFQLNLTALSLLALVVGMFLIYNTVMFGVVQRRTVLGTLRALGTTPAQVFGLVLVETAVASALGALLGLVLGWVLGQSIVRLVTRTINDLYYVLAVTGAPLTAGTVVKALGLGVGAGVLSAVPPALEAARVEPVSALRRSVLESKARRRVPLVTLTGLALGALGAAVLVLFPTSLAASFAGLFGVVLGLALLTPAATLLLMAVLGPVASLFVGTLGRLAARTVTTSIARTGVAIASLMVAISVTIGVSLMIGSFRSTVDNWLGLTLRADIYLGAPGSGGARRAPAISSDLPARVAAVPGVADVETFRAVEVASPEGPVEVSVADPQRERSADLYRFAEGDPASTWRKVQEGAVLVSEPFAFRRRIPPRGGSVTLVTDHGLRTFPVAGTYYDYASERGTVLIARAVYERFWDDRRISSLAVYLRPEASVEEVAERLRAALADTTLRVIPTRALRRNALRVFDRTFAVTEGLRLLAVVVAFVGVWSALMALQTERSRELATLQALGLTPRRLVGLTLLESGFMGLAAGLVALPTGALLAVILV